MMMTLSLFYAVPEFDIAGLFLLTGCTSGNAAASQSSRNSSGTGRPPLPRMGQTPVDSGSQRGNPDPERIRLQTSMSSGPKYTQQLDEDTGSIGMGPVPSGSGLNTRRVIRARYYCIHLVQYLLIEVEFSGNKKKS